MNALQAEFTTLRGTGLGHGIAIERMLAWRLTALFDLCGAPGAWPLEIAAEVRRLGVEVSKLKKAYQAAVWRLGDRPAAKAA